MTQLSPHTAIGGLTLGIDRRQLSQPSVVEGRNFIRDIKGPRSYFAARLFSINKINDARNAQTVRIGGVNHLITSTALYAYDDDAGRFYPIYDFPVNYSEAAWPWSVAFLDGLYFFCRKGNDLTSYDPENREWKTYTGGDNPTAPVACIVSAGRLIVMDEDRIMYSEVGVASFTPDEDTGAGYVLTNAFGGGDPIGLIPSNNGFNAYTSEGVGVFTAVDALNPFTFKAVAVSDQVLTTFAPMSPYAMVALSPTTHVILSRSGLFQIVNGQLTTFEPIMSEWIKNTFLVNTPRNNPYYTRLWYNAEMQLFGVSVSTALHEMEFDRAYVYNLVSQQWGSFDRKHTCVGDLTDNDTGASNSVAAYVCCKGYVWYFTHGSEQQTASVLEESTLQFGAVEIPTYVSDDVVVCSSMLRMGTESWAGLPETAGPYTEQTTEVTDTGLPAITCPPSISAPGSSLDWETQGVSEDWEGTPITADEDWETLESLSVASSCMKIGTAVYEKSYMLAPYDYKGIDSYVLIGPSRLSDGAEVDRLSRLNKVTLATDESVSEVTNEDWEFGTALFDADWENDDLPAEDWGSAEYGPMTFKTDLIGTLDANQVFADNEFLDVPRTLESYDNPEVFRYAPYQEPVGLYHLVKVRAEDQYESFHLKNLELSTSLGALLG